MTADGLDTRALASTLLDLMTDFRRRWHDAVGAEPLPTGLVETLRVIEKHPGITVAELAARLGRQVSNVSTQLRELDARELITREKHPGDKRYVSLFATPKAITMRRALQDAFAAELRIALQGLPDDDIHALRAALPAMDHLAARLDELD